MRTVTAAVKALLVDAGLRAEVGQVPSGGGWQGAPGQSQFNRYIAIHPIASPNIDGPLNDPRRDVSRRFQLNAIGATATSTEAYADMALAAVNRKRVDTDTRVSMNPIWLDELGGVDRDDTVQPALWIVRHIVVVNTTPKVSA